MKNVFAALVEIYCKIGEMQIEEYCAKHFHHHQCAQCKLDQIGAVEIYLNVAKCEAVGNMAPTRN